eukprot:499869-Prorocentrum_minimum.AAC.1
MTTRNGHQSRKGREYTRNGHQSRKGRENTAPCLWAFHPPPSYADPYGWGSRQVRFWELIHLVAGYPVAKSDVPDKDPYVWGRREGPKPAIVTITTLFP